MSNHESLDAEQQAAVEATEKAIAILAGPGSGKTRVLSHRARVLLRRHNKSKALLLTFTNKAAAEMKSRALHTAAVSSDRLRASTFHSFGQNVLRSHGTLVGINTDFEILDNQDQDELAGQAAKIARMSSKARDWGNARRKREQPSADVRKFGEAYEALKRQEGVVDFDDLMVYTAELLEQRPEIAEAYALRYGHLLIDEFQDTNAVQFAVVSALVPHVQTVSVFADDDQAIFRFAGADADNVHRFIKELNAVEYSLTINYRCREMIVERANLLIKADANTSGRQMKAAKAGGSVTVKPFSGVADEAKFVATEIRERIDNGTQPEAISVLVRSGFRSEQLLRELALKDIPVSNWIDQSQETTERRLLRACLAVTGESLNGRHCKRLMEFFRIPECKSKQTKEFLAPYAHLPGVSQLLEISERANTNPALNEILALVHTSVEAVDDEMAFYMRGVINDVQAFQKHDPDFSLDHLLEELSLGSASGPPTVGGGVKVASLHRTKGLQWPVVYIVGLEQDTLPDFRCSNEVEISQERRLCFVGVCRAEEELILTYVRENNGFSKKPSRFLREMKLV